MTVKSKLALLAPLVVASIGFVLWGTITLHDTVSPSVRVLLVGLCFITFVVAAMVGIKLYFENQARKHRY